MKKHIKYSLGLKFSLIIMLMSLMIGALMVVISYQLYSQQIENRYDTEGKVLAAAASEVVDWDMVDAYAETGEEDAAYWATLESLRLSAQAGDARYIYIVKMYDDGVMFIYDTDEDSSNYELGTFLTWEEAKGEFPEAINQDGEFDEFISNDQYGWLFSLYEKEYDSRGEFVAYLGIDYSLDIYITDQRAFITELAVVTLLIAAALTVLFIFIMRWLVIKPVNRIAEAANSYLVEAADAEEGENSITELRVETSDELETLSDSLKTMESKIQDYLRDLKETTHRAETDSMTSLFNREAFEQRVDLLLKNNSHPGFNVFMMIDLDNFKSINDTWGHAVGDEAIAACAGAIRSKFRASDLIARMGGDEFALFYSGPASLDEVTHRAAAICEAVRSIKVSEDIRLTVSVGVAVCPGSTAREYQDLYMEADNALYDVKEKGRDGFIIKTCNTEP